MDPIERNGEHRLTWLDYYDCCNEPAWGDGVLGLLFAIGSMVGLAYGLIRLLTFR